MITPARLAQVVASLERPLLVATDVDGTIAPIVAHPSDARIEPAALAALARIARVDDVHVALITGRDLSSLRRMESLKGVWRAVEHGGLVVPPAGEPVRAPLSESQERALTKIRAWVEQHASEAIVEQKPRGVAVHTRQLSAVDKGVADALLEAFEKQANLLSLHVRCGRELREVEATPQDKSRALREIQERTGANSVFFVGDDLTDFHAIELAQARGVGLFIQSAEQTAQPENASAVWNTVGDVVQFLRSLGDAIE